MINKNELVESMLTDPELQQRLAKHIALRCFRNSILEYFHAGKVPDSKTGDYSDVVVHTPYGEIPWNELSRISDAEMKLLMQDVVNHTFHLIQELFDKRGGELLLKLAVKDSAPEWDDPK